MELRGNKGEWSELYVLLKLLADGRLYCGDGVLNRFDDRYYPILKIFRDDSVDRTAYVVNAAKSKILVSRDDDRYIEIPQEEMLAAARSILKSIKSHNGTFDIPEQHQFLDKINCRTIKAKSSDKADIRIVIHNLNTGSKPELGYSIKSKLGGNSTLINANKDGTNFIYQVLDLDHSQMIEFNSLAKFHDKFNYLRDVGARVAAVGTARQTLHDNLTLLDLGLERIIADELLIYYSSDKSSIEEITRQEAANDPLGLHRHTDQPMYEYKIKQFLLAFALGMTSSKPWYGSFNANGGYIVVKEDGDVVCYHFFDRNDLEEYLYHNTKFETPSTSRHGFGHIYEQAGEFFIKLNLQVRFK